MKKSDRTRQTIVEKTAPLFNKKGVTGTTLTDLTEATGLTKGSIYGNFKDKNAVALAVFDYNIENLFTYLEKSVSRPAAIIDKLLAIPETYRRLYRSMVEFGGCPVANTATEADDTHPELRKRVSDVIDRMTGMIEELLEQGKKSGEVQPLIDSGKTAAILISLIEGGTILSKATGRKRFLRDALEQVDYLIHSIKQNKEPQNL